jgi:hypothetical protein
MNKFKIGDQVTKAKGSEWEGTVLLEVVKPVQNRPANSQKTTPKKIGQPQEPKYVNYKRLGRRRYKDVAESITKDEGKDDERRETDNCFD